MLNPCQLPDLKALLNKSSVHNHKSNNIARSYQEDTELTWRLWQTEFCKLVGFELFPEGANECCTVYIIRKNHSTTQEH